MEKAEDRTPPKIADIPHTMPPQNQADEMCRSEPHCPICTKSTPNPKAENSEDWNGERQDQLERNYCPQSPKYPSSYDIPDIIKQKKAGRRDWNFSMINTI